MVSGCRQAPVANKSSEQKSAALAKDREAVRSYYRAVLNLNQMHADVTEAIISSKNPDMRAFYVQIRGARDIYDEALQSLGDLSAPSGLRAVHNKLERSLKDRKRAASAFLLFLETDKAEFRAASGKYSKKADRAMREAMKLLKDKADKLKIDVKIDESLTLLGPARDGTAFAGGIGA